jgi:hypothetical protein
MRRDSQSGDVLRSLSAALSQIARKLEAMFRYRAPFAAVSASKFMSLAYSPEAETRQQGGQRYGECNRQHQSNISSALKRPPNSSASVADMSSNLRDSGKSLPTQSELAPAESGVSSSANFTLGCSSGKVGADVHRMA